MVLARLFAAMALLKVLNNVTTATQITKMDAHQHAKSKAAILFVYVKDGYCRE